MADPAPPRILPAATVIRRRDDGTLYATSPHQLGPYPDKLTERLDHWATHAPERTFLAQRGADGAWRHVTYGDTRARVRALAQALIDRGLSSDRPVVILSGNSIRHACLALAAMYAGVPYAPIAPAYSLLAREYTSLKALWGSLTPGLVFAEDGQLFERALGSVAGGGHEIVTGAAAASLSSTAFTALERTPPTAAVDAAHARVGGGTVAKILFTSGSTGAPKGVINTQRMLCANQEMLRTALPLLGDQPPVLCDWLPWNHTFGGNHNFGIVLYNGGTLYIDGGRPTPDGFETTLANLREVAPTAYFNVPRGYDLLAPCLRADASLRDRFFSRLDMLFCAAATLRQQVADDLTAAGRAAGRDRVPFVTGLGATESAPFALCAGDAPFTGGRVGVPAPGLELKLVPAAGRLEARLRGPSITPGYWRDPARTAGAFDDEGFYKLGDAVGFVDPADPSQGFVFEGRLTEDFKLSTGTWVRVGALRAALLGQLGDLAFDVVVTGHDRDFVGALIFPGDDAARRLGPAAFRRQVADRLAAFSETHPGSSTAVRRALLLREPPAIDAMELTDKGSVGQRAVLMNRAAQVEQLYAHAPSDVVIVVHPQEREPS